MILGVNVPPPGRHDPRACLVASDGALLAFCEEERLGRVKHAERSGPLLAVAHCLGQAGASRHERRRSARARSGTARSADASTPQMRRRLDAMKGREPWRPFGAAALRPRAGALWQPRPRLSDYMLATTPVSDAAGAFRRLGLDFLVLDDELTAHEPGWWRSG